MFNRIWKKFAFVLLVVSILPIGYFGYQNLKDARSSVIEDTLKTIFLNCVTRGKDIERSFLNAYSDINYLRSNLVMQFYTDNEKKGEGVKDYWKVFLEQEFMIFLSLKPGYSRIGFLDEYGMEVVVVFRSGKNMIALSEDKKRNRLTSAYYEQAAIQDKFGIAAIPMRSSVDPGLDLKSITLIRYATKVFDREGRPQGVIFLDLDGSEISNSLSNTTFKKRRPAAMITSAGNFIYNPFAEEEENISRVQYDYNINTKFPSDVVAQILSGRPGIIADNPDYLFAFSPVFPKANDHKYFYVIFDRYAHDRFNPMLDTIKRKYILASILVMIFCIGAALLVAQALTRNIEKLQEGTKNLKDNRFNFRLDIRSGDEIEALAKAYNLMADALQDYSESLESKVEERSRHIQKVESRLMQAEKLAAVGFLAAGVAHEINNPISIIITRLELMMKAFDKGKLDGIRDDLNVLHNHAIRIGRITSDLLTFSRMKSNVCESVDLNAVITRVVNLVEMPLNKKKISLKLELEEKLPEVWANTQGIDQVVYNIVYNAFQATDVGGNIWISTARHDDDNIEIKIRDNGKGISKDSIERVFEPFYTTKEVGQGTGLGLSISYGLIQDFGGSISVESEIGVGTLFTIILAAASSKSGKTRKEMITG
ncbi:MAG: ATP-binding protein [Nitrospinota bacterium]|nr:ATP-binding protein [Nitrospinota bacterium]